MKNLKKVLAVVLVVCMAFSLVTIASAATTSTSTLSTYSDASSIKQTEAVDLFSGLGFLTGTNGAFSPAANMTREQAAKVITYMLIGSLKADALKTSVSSFSDVATSRWSAAYIQYCAANGIVSGVGNGQFNPEANVTGTQFAKMLLTAVGYGKNGEYTGANWEMTVIADATSLKILTLNVDVTAAATRDQMALYAFNAYTKVSSVVYNSTTKSYQGATDINNSAKGTLAYQQNVKNDVSTSTTDGVVSYKWTKDGLEITGKYTDESVLGTSAFGIPIANLSDTTSNNYIASLDSTVNYYYNGSLVNLALNAAGTATTIAYAIGDHFGYDGVVYTVLTPQAIGVTPAVLVAGSLDTGITKGVVVSLIDTDNPTNNKADAIRVTQKSVAVLSGAPIVDTTNGLVTIAGTGISGVSIAKVNGYTGLVDKDVVLYYKDNKGNYYLEKATAVTGTVGGFASTSSITVAGKTYKYSQLALPSSFTTSTVGNTWLNASATVYLDNGGFAVYATSASTTVNNVASNYAFVTTVAAVDSFGVIKAKLVFSDATTSVVTISSNSSVGNPTANQFYQYSVGSDGTYSLTAITGTYNGAVVAGSEAGMTSGLLYQNNYVYTGAAPLYSNVINAATPTFITDTKQTLATGDDTPTKQTANSDTRFVYNNNAASNNLFAYVGIAAAQTFTEKATTDVIYTLSTATSATASTPIFVYASGSTAAFTAGVTTGTWVYVYDNAKTVNIDSSGTTTYTYKALLNGKLGTVTVASSDDSSTINGTVGLYLVNKFDANNYVKTVIKPGSTSPASTYSANKAVSYSNGNLTYGTTTVTLNSSVVVWFIDTTNDPSTGTIAYTIAPAQINALTSASNYNVATVATSSTDGTISTIYIYGSTT